MKLQRLTELLPAAVRSAIQRESHVARLLGNGIALHQALADPGYHATVAAEWSDSESCALRALVRAFADGAADEERLLRETRGVVSGAQLADALARLRRKGVVFAFRKAWGERVYAIPEESLASWQNALFPELCGGALLPAVLSERGGPVEVTADGESSSGVERELYALLVFASHQELTLTQKGVLHKRSLQKLDGRFLLPADVLKALDLRYAFADVYSPDIALLLDFALRLGLLRAEDGRLEPDAAAVRDWLRLSPAKMRCTLYELWKTIALPGDPWMRHAAVKAERMNGRLSVAALENWLARHELVRQQDEAWKKSMRRWFEALEALGFIESFGPASPDSGRLKWTFRLPGPSAGAEYPINGEPMAPANDGFPDDTRREYRDDMRSAESDHTRNVQPDDTRREYRDAAPDHCPDVPEDQSDRHFYVLPDFELLVPADMPYALRWDIDAMAETVSEDAMRVCRLTPGSVARAVSKGHTADSIAAFLERYASGAVPDNVSAAVREWAAGSGRVSVQAVTLLRCRDKRTADELFAQDNVRAHFIERVGDCDFILLSEQVENLILFLEHADYAPRRGSANPGAPREAGTKRVSGTGGANRAVAGSSVTLNGLFYSQTAIPDYELDDRLAEPDDLYPQWRSLPAMWLRDCRTYHPSTARDIVRKAIEWKALLRLRIGGELTSFIPERLQDERGGWRLAARIAGAPVLLEPERWEGMQLVLPGINEE